MIGLSTTAVGGRMFTDCLKIYAKLEQPLGLEFLELAIGSRAQLSKLPATLPLMIHNDWVYDLNGCRIKADLMTDNGWLKYKQLTQTHTVLGFSWHFPKRSAKYSLADVLRRQVELEQYLERPFSLELMPDATYYGNLDDWQQDLLQECKLCVDLSHLNIWAKSNPELVKDYAQRLAPQAASWHVSSNRGFKDTHDLIPTDSWILPWITANKHQMITYEALPQKYKIYDRTDRVRTR
jgi:hypothetical protein